MRNELSEAIDELTSAQKEAALWTEGPILVLAGPGSGKTRVLTTRIAFLLDKSENNRILALTFTTKAADEMRLRVRSLGAPEDRALIGTFHSFCMNVLRKHGIHLEIKPDFSIYSREEDRLALLVDCLRTNGKEDLIPNADNYLKAIDRLKRRLLGPSSAIKVVTGENEAKTLSFVYELYDKALQENGILDFDSLIFQTCKLLKVFPTIAEQYRKTYKYWLLDEFQDTNPAQYFLMKSLAGNSFKNVFIVGDEDQIVYQWNGASYKQIENFRNEFNPYLIQLPTNFRCPPTIVNIANLLVTNNSLRVPNKKALDSGKKSFQFAPDKHISVLDFPDETSESENIAQEISLRDVSTRIETVVLARTRAQLQVISETLRKLGVNAVIAQRRDNFLTPYFTWLDIALKHSAFPLDLRSIRKLIDSFNSFTGGDISIDVVTSQAETGSKSYVDVWSELVNNSSIAERFKNIARKLFELTKNTTQYKTFISDVVEEFTKLSNEEQENLDLVDDIYAWKSLVKEIRELSDNNLELSEFVQEIDIRSKEPPLREGSVALMTIHGAKGKEFDYVYLTSAVEGTLPYYLSVKAGDKSPAMEEERRSCFVAITRTKECLTISWPNKQRGYVTKPSRFLVEMGLI